MKCYFPVCSCYPDTSSQCEHDECTWPQCDCEIPSMPNDGLARCAERKKVRDETGVAAGRIAISVTPDDEVNLGPIEEVLTFPELPGDEAFARRWFPRELRVRIDVTATAPDDRWLSREIHRALAWLVQQDYVRDGAYPSGYETDWNGVRMRLTWSNRHGSTWYWRAWNALMRWWRNRP